MKLFLASFPVALFLSFVSPVQISKADEAGIAKQVAKEIETYYESRVAPNWEKDLQKIKKGDSIEKAESYLHLKTFLGELLKGETSGKAPWRPVPYWEPGESHPSIELRKDILRTTKAADLDTDALEIYDWFLRNEKIWGMQEEAAKAIIDLKSEDAKQQIENLIETPLDNHRVTVMLLEAAVKLKLQPDLDALEKLCLHHRQSVRKAALQLFLVLGGKDKFHFDGAKALGAAPLKGVFSELAKAGPKVPGADQKYVEITETTQIGDEEQKIITKGWLLEESQISYRIFSPFGLEKEILKKSVIQEDGELHYWTSTLKNLNIEDEVEWVKTLRAEGDPNDDLSPQAGLTGQVEGALAQMYEATLGLWLLNNGKEKLAAEILLPALDLFARDSDFLDITRHRMSDLTGYKMLCAFAGDRELETALELAKTIRDNHPLSRFYDEAVNLAKEIPKRRDDFKTFRLPTPVEWKELESKIPRAERVDYLCQRLRLLNVFQNTGFDFACPQYREACGLSPNATHGKSLGKTSVINPYSKLLGLDDANSAALISDLPELAKYLEEDWHIPAVSYWRDYSADRTLHRSREVLCAIINSIAERELCSAEWWHFATEEERTEALKKIKEWAEANKGRTSADLCIEHLKNELKGNKSWRSIETQAEKLAKAGSEEGAKLMLEFLEAEEISLRETRQIFNCLRRTSPATALKATEKYLSSGDIQIRLDAGIIILKAGDKKKALEFLKAIYSKETFMDADKNTWLEGVYLLLAENNPEALEVAAQILKTQALHYVDAKRPELLNLFAEQGCAKAYDFYLDQLNNRGKAAGKKTYPEAVCDFYLREILHSFRVDQDALQKAKALKDKDSQIKAVKDWLTTQIVALKSKN